MSMRLRGFIGRLFWAGLLCGGLLSGCGEESWTDHERQAIQALSLASLPSLEPDVSNRVADLPAAKALGEKLFFDTALSGNGGVACASCHLPDRQFQDDLALAKGVGTANRRTMPIRGTAFSPWMFWDGRKDSQWSQALGPLENPVEHGTDRLQVVRHVLAQYGAAYVEIFGAAPMLDHLPPHASPQLTGAVQAAWMAMSPADQFSVNQVFANIGKAIAAYERSLMPLETRFDRYAKALAAGAKPAGDAAFSAAEAKGLKLFISTGTCMNCHNGPLLTDQFFHNTGVAEVPGLPADRGRGAVLTQIKADPFSCIGPFSDAKAEQCSELRFMSMDEHELERAYKTPSLRGAASRAPYMHAGQIGSLAAVVDHYAAAPAAPSGHTALKPLALSADDRQAIVAFLKTLEP